MIVNLKNRTSDYFDRTDTLVRYYEDIRRFKLLTYDEEIACFRRYKNGSQKEKQIAKNKLVNSNQRFVVAVAKKFGNNENVLDLINEGNLGLLEAIDKFDTDKGVKFSTFAIWYIRRAINMYIINHSSIVTKSNMSKTYHLVSQATNKFIQKELRQPTLEELKEILNKDYNVNIKNTLDVANTKFISIDNDSDREDDNSNFADISEYNTTSSSLNDYEKDSSIEFNKKLVSSMLNKLGSREKKIIQMLFGIGYDREYELQEIAKELNLTTERVRQLKFSTINKLKGEYKKAIAKI